MAERLVTKRKGVDDGFDFSDFPLSSPARKIRRLDAEIPPMIYEGPKIVPSAFAQPLPGDEMVGGAADEISMVSESMPSSSANDDRTLVLYRPMENPFVLSPSSYRVDSDLINVLKGKSFLQDIRRAIDDKSGTSNNCLAVVPWVPSQPLVRTSGVKVTAKDDVPVDAEMEAEVDDSEGASMDVEEMVQSGTEGFHEWPQQHCMTPQFPPNTSTPVTWS